MKDALKRKSTFVIGIGFILHIVTMFMPVFIFDYGSEKIGASWIRLIEVVLQDDSGDSSALFWLIWLIVLLIILLTGLAEFICAIAYKKAVFVLSIIQTVVSVLVFAIDKFVLYANDVSGGENVEIGIAAYFSIIACLLLLVGGIMFKKERASIKP